MGSEMCIRDRDDRLEGRREPQQRRKKLFSRIVELALVFVFELALVFVFELVFVFGLGSVLKSHGKCVL